MFIFFQFLLLAALLTVTLCQEITMKEIQNLLDSKSVDEVKQLLNVGESTMKNPLQGGARHLTDELNAALSFDYKACRCADRAVPGIMECIDDKDESLGLFEIAFAICVETSTPGITFDQIYQFGWQQGSLQRSQYEHGDLVAPRSFLLDHGIGTNKFYLTGFLLEISFRDSGFLWEMFKRSIRAIVHNKMKLSGIIVANVHGEYEDVPFEFDIPVSRFRVLPFMKDNPFPDYLDTDKMGGLDRRVGFAMFVIFTALVVYCLVRDIISLTLFLRRLCCTKKNPTTILDIEKTEADIEQTEANDANIESDPEDIV
jgi:hypothetical protein